MIDADSVFENRHHPCNTRSTSNAENVFVFVRTEYSARPKRSEHLDAGLSRVARKQPIAEASTRLALQYERELACRLVKIDH